MDPRALRVSVVIPTYNGAAYVRETIASVLDQEWAPYEIVVCDDGSKDRSAEIARSFGPRVRVVEQQNRGVAAARNRGAQESTGELIAFLDHDDVWDPQLLSTLVPLIAANPAWSLVYADSWMIDQSGARSGRRREHLAYRAGWVFSNLLLGNFIPVETTVLRRASFEQVGGFDESLRYMEDYALNLALASRGPVGFCNRPLASYRLHDANLSHDAESALFESLRVLEALSRPESGLESGDGELVVRRCGELWGSLAWHALRAGDLEEVDRRLGLAGSGCSRSRWWMTRVARTVVGALPPFATRILLEYLPWRRHYGVSRPAQKPSRSEGARFRS